MRLIGGKWRAKKLTAPAGDHVRPTSDRARGALFDVLLHGKPRQAGFRIQNARVLDAFAGTGALGLEALSRGAGHATFMDNAAASIRIVKENIDACNAGTVSTVLKADAVTPPPASVSCGLVFLDPPYGQNLMAPALAGLTEQGWIANGGICCAELGKAEAFDPPAEFELLDERRYGAARILLFIRRS